VRQVDQPPLALPAGLAFDCRLEMEGLCFLGLLRSGAVLVVFPSMHRYCSMAT